MYPCDPHEHFQSIADEVRLKSAEFHLKNQVISRGQPIAMNLFGAFSAQVGPPFKYSLFQHLHHSVGLAKSRFVQFLAVYQ